MRINHEFPEIGSWYWKAENPKVEFEIVAIDMENELIEIQYLDGGIEEIDFEGWFSIQYIEMAPPKERFAPFDLEKEIETEEYTEMGDDLLHPQKKAPEFPDE